MMANNVANNPINTPMDSNPSLKLSEKIAQICVGLKPFQALEYDPETNTISIITECLVPSKAVDQISRIVASRRDDEKITVRRYADKFKITFVRCIKLQN